MAALASERKRRVPSLLSSLQPWKERSLEGAAIVGTACNRLGDAIMRTIRKLYRRRHFDVASARQARDYIYIYPLDCILVQLRTVKRPLPVSRGLVEMSVQLYIG